jgi:aspartyl/asparaginyl-tRNA synthetase
MAFLVIRSNGGFTVQCLVQAQPDLVSLQMVKFAAALIRERFVEIHTPKLIAASSEGGAAVFRLDYKGQLACLPFCVLMLLDNFQRAG